MNYLHVDPQVPLQAESLFSVRDQVVVITGGGTGLGRYLAEGFVSNAARVYIVGRRGDVLGKTAKEVSEAQGASGGGKIFPITGDISTKAGAKAIADQISQVEDHVDVLVNNAAVQVGWKVPIKSVEDHSDPDFVEKLVWDGVDDEDWNTTNNVNINGTYFITAALVPLLRKSELKSVIVISSIAASANQRATSTLTYGVSKAASRLSPLGIRVNTISPGTFASEITSTRDDQGNVHLKAPAGKACLRTPQGRAGYKHEIFGPVLLLASRAGQYMNNAMLAVDGGRNMLAGINDGIPQPAHMF